MGCIMSNVSAASVSLTPETKEEYSAQIPALQLLVALGWEYHVGGGLPCSAR